MDKGASDKSDRAGGPADLSRCASQPEALIPSASDIERWLSEPQRNALLAMPFRSKGCGFQPGVLVSLRCNFQLADYYKFAKNWKAYFRTPLGDAVAQAIEARRAATGTGAVHESGHD